MAVTVNLPTTAAQDNKLSKLLTNINAQRISAGQPTYADINAMSSDVLADQLVAWVRAMNDQEAQQVKEAYDAATNSIKNQVKSLLGIS